MAEATIH